MNLNTYKLKAILLMLLGLTLIPAHLAFTVASTQMRTIQLKRDQQINQFFAEVRK